VRKVGKGEGRKKRSVFPVGKGSGREGGGGGQKRKISGRKEVEGCCKEGSKGRRLRGRRPGRGGTIPKRNQGGGKRGGGGRGEKGSEGKPRGAKKRFGKFKKIKGAGRGGRKEARGPGTEEQGCG